MTRFDQTNPNFDQWLDGFVRGESTPNNETSSDDSESRQLRHAANQFHDLAGRADQLTGDPAMNERLDHIWENVMMNAQVPAAAGIGSGGGVSAEATGMANPVFARHRWPAIVNSLVAAALIIGLSFGVWQTFQGLNSGGGGGDDGGKEVQFSALVQGTADAVGTPQVVNQDGTPVAAPVVGSIDMPIAEECAVTPLTVDQVLAAIDQPYEGQLAPDAPNDFVGSGAEDISSSYVGAPPEELFNQVSALQREWSACVLAGSWMQLFALLDPATLERIVTDRFYPTYLTKAEGRVIIETLESTGLGPHGETAGYVFGDHRITLVNPDPSLSRMVGQGYVQPNILVFGLDGEIQQLLDYPVVNRERTYAYSWDRQSKTWRLADVQTFLG